VEVPEALAPAVSAVPDPAQSSRSDTGFIRTGSRTRYRQFTTRNVTVEQAMASAPVQLFAGENMVLDFGTATNSFSEIAAGGNITATGGALTNAATSSASDASRAW
jgi:hypothetical protein